MIRRSAQCDFADAWFTPFDVHGPESTPLDLNAASPHVE